MGTWFTEEVDEANTWFTEEVEPVPAARPSECEAGGSPESSA